MYLRFSPTGQNIWAVKRGTETIGEVLLHTDGTIRLISAGFRAFELDELESITAFMSEAHKKDSAIVLRMETPKGDAQHGRLRP